MRNLFFLAVVGLLLFSFLGCKSPVPTYTERLEKFEKILTPAIRQEFDAKNYAKTITLMEKEYQANKIFREALEKVKNDEAINLFSIREVVEFYRDYFVSKNEKNK